MRTAAITLTVLLAAAPAPLAGQEVPPDLKAAAVARGLPVEPLIQKAMEGNAKGVPADRLEMALRLVLSQLDTAAVALRQGGIAVPDSDVIAAGGFAVNAGLRSGDIAELARSGAGSSDMIVALRVAGTLVAMGVPPAESVALVSANLRAHRPQSELLGLAGRVQSEMARGAKPAQAAKGLARAAAAQGRTGVPPGHAKPDHPNKKP
jgi:hypothetical protein